MITLISAHITNTHDFKTYCFVFLQIVLNQLISILKQFYQSYDYAHVLRTGPKFNQIYF